jgi:hypothetical protein
MAAPWGAAAMNNRGGRYSERERERVGERRLEKNKEEEEQKTDNWCRLLGTSSLKEGAV